MKVTTIEIVKVVQREAFSKELDFLKEENMKPPILFDVKYPMIVPAHHNVSSMIISHYHERSGHVGASHVLLSMHEMFWIIA
jgi:hypothetical protein